MGATLGWRRQRTSLVRPGANFGWPNLAFDQRYFWAMDRLDTLVLGC